MVVLSLLPFLSPVFVGWCSPPAEGASQRQAWKIDVPRVTARQLNANRTLRNGHHPYILVDGFLSAWRAVNWTLDSLATRIPFAWVYFYRYNLLDPTQEPYYMPLGDAFQAFSAPSKSPRYMHINVGLRAWRRLAKDLFSMPVPDVLWDDSSWIEQCMRTASTGDVDTDAVDNFLVTSQWKFLLIGEKRTTMYLHKDGNAHSAWQAQLVGRKRWTLCPPDQSHLLDESLNTFSVDYVRHPQFAQAACGRATLSPGELLYYPAFWWHQTQQLASPTIAFTSNLVGVEADRVDLGPELRPHALLFQNLSEICSRCWQRGKEKRLCDDQSVHGSGLAPPPLRIVCDEYLPECFKLWDSHAQGLRAAHSNGEL